MREVNRNMATVKESIIIKSLLSILMLVYSVSAVQAVTKDPYTYFFDETWGDFSEELQRAKQLGKKGVLLFFEMDDCPFCHRMKQTVLNQPNVQSYYKTHFLNISVDIEGDIDIVDFSGESMLQKDFSVKKNRVRATPVFAFYNLEGKQVTRYTGATSSVEEFLWLGEYVANQVYKEMPFTKYKRQKRKASK